MRSLSARWNALGTVAIAMLTGACGSANSSTSTFDDVDGGATSGDSSTNTNGDSTTSGGDTGGDPPPKKDSGVVGEDTSPPDIGTSATTLDNVCNRLAEAKCSKAFTTCCATEGLPVKEGACRSDMMSTCGDQVSDIKGGKGSFNPAAFPACAAALNTLASKCNVPLLEFVKTYAPCFQLLNGAGAPGSSCGSATDCKAPDGAFAICSRDGRCESVTIVGTDKMCVYSGSTRAICDYGQACIFGMGTFVGTCKPAKMLGAACSGSTECGFGNWCERSFSGPGKCVVGRTAGASCSENAQCASSSCSSGNCTDPMWSPVDASSCSGA